MHNLTPSPPLMYTPLLSSPPPCILHVAPHVYLSPRAERSCILSQENRDFFPKTQNLSPKTRNVYLNSINVASHVYPNPAPRPSCILPHTNNAHFQKTQNLSPKTKNVYLHNFNVAPYVYPNPLSRPSCILPHKNSAHFQKTQKSSFYQICIYAVKIACSLLLPLITEAWPQQKREDRHTDSLKHAASRDHPQPACSLQPSRYKHRHKGQSIQSRR
jgi:hypothetical protein